MKRYMRMNVAILIFDDAEVLDFAGPFEVFSVTSQLNEHEQVNVFTIAKEQRTYSAVNGLKVQPEYDITDHPPIDILIIAGGQGTRNLMNDIDVLQWVSQVHASSRITLSICSASRLMGALGLLDHRPFCTHQGVYEHMKEIAPRGIPQKRKRFIQTDERLYTSGGISAGIDLSFYIVGQLFGADAAKRTSDYMEYNYQL